jgi:sugar phosphate isomerase/epimerase
LSVAVVGAPGLLHCRSGPFLREALLSQSDVPASAQRLGLSPLGFLDLPPPDLIAVAAQAGFAAVGLRTAPAVPGGVAYALEDDPALLQATLDAAARWGLKIRTIEMISLSRETTAAALRPVFEAGARVGATRVLCTGNDPDMTVVTDAFAVACQTAAAFGMGVDLEFMRFRSVQTLEQACEVVRGAGAANGAIVLDCLHLVRSGGTAEQVAALPPGRIGNLQLCDAPAASPPAEGLATEAREDRLPPGEGDLPLAAIVAAAARVDAIDAEVPLGASHAGLDALAKARVIHDATVRFLASLRRPGA